MTHHHDPLDDLASAHLDGLSSAGDAARVDADPDLLARVARLDLARRALLESAADPVDPDRRELAIDAALAAFDADAGADDLDVAAAAVPIAAARRRWSARRTLQLVGAAAALALVALTVPLLDRLDPGSNEDLTGPRVADEALEATAGVASDSTAAATAGGGGPTAQPSTLAQADLGDFADLDGLTDVVRAELDSGGTERYAADGAATADGPCATDLAAGDRVVYAALASLEGRPVVVAVRATPEDDLLLTLLDRGDCSVLSTTAL